MQEAWSVPGMLLTVPSHEATIAAARAIAESGVPQEASSYLLRCGQGPIMQTATQRNDCNRRA